MDEYEEEENKLNRFRDLATKQELTLTEYMESVQRGDEMVELFVGGYLSGVLVEQFYDMPESDKRVHLELLEVVMILSRKRGNMEMYHQLKEIIEKLK